MPRASEAYPVSAEPLERLHALLVDAIRRRRGADPHGAPVTVAEIYQELVPYRSVRAALGLDMNADYEHTLLRLLSGEGRLARVEPGAAREQMERELASPNPNVALYRKFAGCDVWLLPSASTTPAWVADHLAEIEVDVAQPLAHAAAEPLAATAPAAAEEPVSASADDGPGGAPADDSPSEAPADDSPNGAPADDSPNGAPADDSPSEAPTSGVEQAPQPEPPPNMTIEQPKKTARAAPVAAVRPIIVVEAGHCAFCDSSLPTKRQVRFCPFCGQDQSQRPCATCGEPVQQDWAYCVACGEAVTAADA